MKKNIYFIVVIVVLFSCSTGSVKTTNKKQNTPFVNTNSPLKEISGSIATDSFHHDMGKVSRDFRYLMKPFRYIGNKTVLITRTWTGDPHFICEFPKTELIKDSTYYLKICFAFEGKQGVFKKDMGFNLTNGESVTFTFSGSVLGE